MTCVLLEGGRGGVTSGPIEDILKHEIQNILYKRVFYIESSYSTISKSNEKTIEKQQNKTAEAVL